MTNFYLMLEDGVRKWVKLFREQGINTECSCHHEGYIQCQTLDQTYEIRTIRSIMLEKRIKNYTIEFLGEETNGFYHQHLIIRSDLFKKDY